MKKIDLDSIFHHSDHSQKGHGLTLTEVYRSYKNSPHNVDATYLKYLVHRLENVDKYESASPEEKNKMDVEFLKHHQTGSAAEKNGHLSADSLESFMLNPDTPKLAKQLLNHKKQLSDFIQKEHSEHIVNINGEPHLRLTRGLSVDRANRGTDHALASYADIHHTGFGKYMHHQLVPLKNVWFAYDYGPIKATSKKFGNENEFLVSPHQNIYNEEHTKNPTKPIAVRNYHSLKVKVNDFRFKRFNKNMSQQGIDTIAQYQPFAAAAYLKDHPLFNANHVDTIVQKDPNAAAQYLHDHPLLNVNHIDSIVQNNPEAAAQFLQNHKDFNVNHIDTIIKKDPLTATKYLKDHLLFNQSHIDTIVQNAPQAAMYYFKNHHLLNTSHIDTFVKTLFPYIVAKNFNDHPLLNEQHIDTIVQKDPEAAAQFLQNHKDFNANHIDTIVQKDPWAAAQHLKNNPIYQAKYGNKVQKSLQKSVKQSYAFDSMFPTDDSLSGHGLTLTKVYRSYKNSPHNVDATYLKYLVHRLENVDKYESASPEEKNKMDVDFLSHHQKREAPWGSAAEKNGHMTVNDLQNFIKNPDTPKLAKQLLNHKKQLADFIQKEHSEHIVNINGEPHLKLTRGLTVSKSKRGTEHALTSYADIPNPKFGDFLHHQFVPLKNIWYSYDYGPEEAVKPFGMFDNHGTESEFVVSPHQIIYNENHKENPTKPIAYRQFHSFKINKDIFSNYVDNLVQKNPENAAKFLKEHLNANHIDSIVEKNQIAAAEHLRDHPLFNANHIQAIIKKEPSRAAAYFYNHPLLNTNHFNFIMNNAAPESVAKYLSNNKEFNANHIQFIAKKSPSIAAKYLGNHPLFDASHIDTIVKKDPQAAAKHLGNHPLLNASHIDTIMQKLHPIMTIQYIKNHPSFNANHLKFFIESTPASASYIYKHPLLNEQHIDTIVKMNPKDAAQYLSNNPIYQAKYGNKVQKSLQKSIKQASEVDSMFPTDHLQKGHGLTLTKMYYSYKRNPHNVDATYGKYLVHRLENADKYKQATPDEQFKMDSDFLNHHYSALKKQSRSEFLTNNHLQNFIKNPDTLKLAKELLNHKKQLANFIQKEHSEHIVNINGEPHLRLTRGLNVDRANRGADHALASYADVPDTGFGIHMHHQLVPLKNIWFAYDYGPKEATSYEGNQNEFLVSPHQNIYNEESNTNPTKPIAYKNLHSLSLPKNTQELDDFVQKNPIAAAQYLKKHSFLNNANYIQTIAEKDPKAAAQYLFSHKDFNKQHIDIIIQKDPQAAAKYLKDHPLFNQSHVDTIVQKDPWAAAAFLNQHPLLNANHIQTIVQKDPSSAAAFLNQHPLLNANHIQTIAEKSPDNAAIYLNNHHLLNEQHIDTIVKNDLFGLAAQHLKNNPIYQAKYGNKVQKSLQKSTKISKQLSNKVRQLLNSKAVLNKTRGTLKFPKILPKDTRPEENVKQIPKDEPEHEQYGGLFTVKPAEQQFIQAALAGAPSKEKHREAPQIRQQIHGGGLGGAYTLKTKQAFAFNPAFHVKAHEGLHSLVGKAAQKLNVKEDDVYNHLNSLIHPEDQAKLKATLSAYDYKPHTHPTEMIPRISDILHDKKVRSAFLNQHYPIDQDWSTFNPDTLTSGFHDPNVKAGWQAIQRLGRTWNAIVKMGKDLEKLP